MLSTKDEEEKPDFCCEITWRRFWNFSKGPKPIRDFREPFAGTWKVRRMYKRHSSRRETSRFRVSPAKRFTSQPMESAAITTTSSPCPMEDGESRLAMFPERESARPC